MTTPETAPQVAAIQEAVSGVKVFEVPETRELLNVATDVPHYENRHSRDAAARSLILHTSGSTGKLCDNHISNTIF